MAPMFTSCHYVGFFGDTACLEAFVMNWNLMALNIGLDMCIVKEFLLQRDGNLVGLIFPRNSFLQASLFSQIFF